MVTHGRREFSWKELWSRFAAVGDKTSFAELQGLEESKPETLERHL